MSAEILVVDDNQANLKLVRVLLEIEGYQVKTAVDANEGLRILESYSPRLVLTDIQLPGMDGLEFTKKIKSNAKFASVTVVALTSYAMKGDEQKMREAGCDGYISKPIDTREFPGLVAKFLGSGAAAGS